MTTKQATLVDTVNGISDQNKENKRKNHSDNGSETQKKTKQQERLERRERRTRTITIDEHIAEATELLRNGKCEAAMPLYREAVSMQAKFRTYDSFVKIRYAFELHLKHLTCLSKYKEARKVLQDYLEITTRLYGVDHPFVALANWSYDMGVILYWRDKCHEAMRKAHVIQVKNDESRPEDIAQTLSRIADIHSRKREKQEAMELYRKALEIQRETFGKIHPEVASTLLTMASDLFDRDEHEAMNMFVKAVSIGLQLDGADREDVIFEGLEVAAINNIHQLNDIDRDELPSVARGEAIIKTRKGRVVKAKDCSTEQVSQRQERIRTKKALNLIYMVGNILLKLGRIIREGGTHGQAMYFYQHLLKAQVEALGADHPLIACTHLNIGIVLCDQSKFDEAFLIFQKVLLVQQQVLGSHHEDVGLTYGYIGRALFGQGKHGESIQSYQKALKIELRTLGNRHPDVANTYFCLGRALVDHQGHGGDGRKMFKEALDILLETYGEGHTAVIEMKTGISEILGMESPST
eukprot:CAMPEP_0113624332 /NCGR_PEP_ID=MMETSP0017_2-20120614/12538_1 /TAXON_ID=2856 /ORGANISM="Cylindrotheca closterium" /LENGTH=522 /DNA_ID=CAMNT_0000534349 /DNA_START=410 /DNA_END=1980 /DNA_ORIENTATION=+ /assembly_acc=CAM_ASM_000147